MHRPATQDGQLINMYGIAEHMKYSAGLTPGGIVRITAPGLHLDRNAPVDGISVPMPTLLCSEPGSSESDVIITASSSERLRSAEDIKWSESVGVTIRVGHRLTIQGLGSYLRQRESKVSFISLHLLQLAQIHSHYVEEQRLLGVGPDVAIDTHQQKLLIDGRAVDCGTPQIRLLSLLASGKKVWYGYSDLKDITDFKDPRWMTTAITRLRACIKENMPPGYGVESEPRVGYRLQVPESLDETRETLAEPFPNA